MIHRKKRNRRGPFAVAGFGPVDNVGFDRAVGGRGGGRSAIHRTVHFLQWRRDDEGADFSHLSFCAARARSRGRRRRHRRRLHDRRRLQRGSCGRAESGQQGRGRSVHRRIGVPIAHVQVGHVHGGDGRKSDRQGEERRRDGRRLRRERSEVRGRGKTPIRSRVSPEQNRSTTGPRPRPRSPSSATGRSALAACSSSRARRRASGELLRGVPHVLSRCLALGARPRRRYDGRP